MGDSDAVHAHRARRNTSAGSEPVGLHFQRPAWQHQAACNSIDPDLFFPKRGASTREAKEVCRGCAVRDDCLEYALTTSQKFGIWGGLSERERRPIRRTRRQQRQETAA